MRIVINQVVERVMGRINQDENGDPKSHSIGGAKLGVVSGQKRKRSWREEWQKYLPELITGMRTSKLHESLHEKLMGRNTGIDSQTLRLLSEVGANVFVDMKLRKSSDEDDAGAEGSDSDGMEAKSRGVAFISEGEQKALVEATLEAYNEPKAQETRAKGKEEAAAKEAKAKKAKAKKAESVETASEEAPVEAAKKNDEAKERDFKKELGFDKSRVSKLFRDKTKSLPFDALDVGAFGRFVADEASLEVESAVHAAGEFTTHRCSLQSDNFTVKEEFIPKNGLMPKEHKGAATMGNASLLSGCFYGCQVIDVDQLFRNYPVDDAEKRKKILVSMVTSAITGVPTAGQSSTNSRELPQYVLAYVCEGQEVTLAGAFTTPVQPMGNEGYVEPSIAKLEAEFKGVKADSKSLQFDTLGIKADFSYRRGTEQYPLGKFIEDVCNAALN